MHHVDVSSRGSGFIISGGNTAIEKKIVSKQNPTVKRHSISIPIGDLISSGIDKLCYGFKIYTSEASKINKKF